MCGIVGYVGVNEYAARRLEAATKTLRHRGPDGAGFAYVEGDQLCVRRDGIAPVCPVNAAAALGHTRLSILDQSTRSDQPFRDRSGKRVVAYNGEIYNFVELREELTSLGHEFASSGDTEVLMAAYREWGDRLTERLVGMWAFALLDLERRAVLLSRDRFGIKPLYYAIVDGSLLFASEIKALRALAPGSFEPNSEVVASFIVDGVSDYGSETFFRDIRRFPAGSSVLVPLDRRITTLTPRRYWRLAQERADLSAVEASEQFRTLLTTAVHEHLRSDVPTASCLSGGLDSSSIVGLAARRTNTSRARRPYSAFGYCPDDERVSERSFMARVANAAGVGLVAVTPTSAHVADALSRLLRHHDEPVGSASVLAQWLVFEAVRQAGATVALDGQGADEVLGGYHSYYIPRLADLLRSGRAREATALFKACSANGTGAVTGKGLLMALLPRSLDGIVSSVRVRRVRRNGVPPSDLFTPAMRHAYSEVVRGRGTLPENTFRQAREADLLDTRLPALLRYEDTNSMAHSVESRVPFLDHRLVDFATSLPDDLLMSGAETKHILRTAMRGIVPSEILGRQDKVGFRADPAWTASLLADRSNDLEANVTEWEAQWFDQRWSAELLAPQRVRENAGAEFLAWRIANVKLWLRHST